MEDRRTYGNSSNLLSLGEKPFGQKRHQTFFDTESAGTMTESLDHMGQQCHKYQLQPNAGKIPTTIKQWREKNGGTHAVITTMYITVDTEPDAQIFEEAATQAISVIGAP